MPYVSYVKEENNEFCFKEVFYPDYATERLNDMLSCIIGQKVKIINVLSNQGARIASETSLLMTDILVQLENGSLVNVEIQKIGIAFPGGACRLLFCRPVSKRIQTIT